MIEALKAPEDAPSILRALTSVQAQIASVELARAQLVLAWVDAHPGDRLADAGASTVPWQVAEEAVSVREVEGFLGGERALELGGTGTPLVAEFCLAELAAILSCSAASARRLAGDLLELRHRLRGCWRRFEDLEVPLWRVRRVAQATIDLSPHAAAYVDRQVSAKVHAVGVTALDRIVSAARWCVDPDEAQAILDAAQEQRQVSARPNDAVGGLVWDVHATLDYDDAVDFERAVAAAAEALAAAGSTDDLDVRRAKAVGVIARGDLVVATEGSSEAAPLPAASREVVLYVHLSEAAVGGSASTAWLETGPLRTVPVALVRQWCGSDSTTRITVRPVLDPSAEASCAAYTPSPTIAETVIVRDVCCVFPGCSTPARTSDLDHIEPHAAGGETSTRNLAPLCRLHHRLKTHGDWRYVRVDPVTPSERTGRGGARYEWTSPHRQRFLVETQPGAPPETRRLADLRGGVAGPASITIDPTPIPTRYYRDVADDWLEEFLACGRGDPPPPSPDDVPSRTPRREMPASF